MEISQSYCQQADFPVGQRVMVIVEMQDFHFFHGEKGVVERNEDRYLGINVRFDKPRQDEKGVVLTTFGFNPSDLVPIQRKADLPFGKKRMAEPAGFSQ